ncbi:MAG: hypothetical protein EBT36_07470 [Betaproteobacteria bacterium]|jgi:hypothetical protein|nr:hypothetical protein [Pseudomonadota bacterium]NBO95078.1 hypothetical protein [Betaproteobacteria bacterium]NDG05198.1 hypothetical protein [Alphaproteobacteria bacterium]NBP35252.1 hypothetical protein [Betaproteobacteria bacterium]NBP37679.1 hypothetical protein [Betaproteobacteria bacterium]
MENPSLEPRPDHQADDRVSPRLSPQRGVSFVSERIPEDRWFPLAVARTKITMRWLSSLSVLGVGLAIWLERGASLGLAAFALMLGLLGLALHQSVARAGA